MRWDSDAADFVLCLYSVCLISACFLTECQTGIRWGTECKIGFLDTQKKADLLKDIMTSN